MIIDLHTHSFPLSDDSDLSPDELVERTKRAGLDGICISDHDRFWDPRDILALARRHSFPVFPACEINTEDGHFLVYGLTRYVFGMHRTRFLRHLVDQAGGAMIVAHPYRRRYSHGEAVRGMYGQLMEDALHRADFLDCVDGLEVLNGRGKPDENAFSLDMAARRGLPGTGASDAHKPSEVGTFATKFQRRIETLDDLIAELRAGRFIPVVAPQRQARLPEQPGALAGRG